MKQPAANRAAKRIRRTPEEARRLILEVAQARIARTGPEGLRLQDIAAEAGISHPTILHHFGSREGLVRALTNEAAEELKTKLLAAIAAGGPNDGTPLDQVFEAFRGGLAQRMAWLATIDPSGERAGQHQISRQIADALHARRVATAPAGQTVDRADTDSLVYLVAVAAVGDAMFGTQLRRSAGQAADAATDKAFRTWLAALVNAHLAGR
jgi:TetR/AcrR family transcriptional regulator, repressor for neighboring sulfatase